jgi:uncharacterized protein involved in type VI secretion and phage assembly
MSERVKGVLIGIVDKLDDPEELGRVQLTFPTRGDLASSWARVATPLAGPDLGMYFQPESGDEALVIFGEDSAPYIIGYLWSGENLPPSTEPKERLIKSVEGNKITLNDTGEKGITIEDANGNIIEMTSKGIRIESSGEITIKGSMIRLNP